MTRASGGFPSRGKLLADVQGILERYRKVTVTLRQLFYLLVGARLIPKTERAYKNVVAATSDWRREGQIPFSVFADPTRGLDRLDQLSSAVRSGRQYIQVTQQGGRVDDPDSWLHELLAGGVELASSYDLARWWGQPYRIIVALEKQALEAGFREVCHELCVDLAVCRGYSSLSFLKEISDSLTSKNAELDGRETVILYFGDFDPSGLNIPETIERDLHDLFGREFRFERIALTLEQAEDLQLLSAPPKESDSRTSGFVREHGVETFELASIEPLQLQQLIRDSVARYWDPRVDARREKLIAKGRDQISSKLDESGIRDLIEELGK